MPHLRGWTTDFAALLRQCHLLTVERDAYQAALHASVGQLHEKRAEAERLRERLRELTAHIRPGVRRGQVAA